MKSMSSLSRGSGGQVVGSFSIAWGEGGGGKERERMNMFLMALFCRIIFSIYQSSGTLCTGDKF